VEAAGFGRPLDPVVEAVDFHKVLASRITAVDAMDPHEDLTRYTLVIAPRLWMVDAEVAANLTAYVESGGTLCLTAGSGVVDEFGKSFDIPRPGPLQGLAGITVSDLAHQDDLQLPLASATIPGLDPTPASLVADEIHLEGAEVVATHAGGWRDGWPAITVHAYGKGRVAYVGVRLAPPAIDALVGWLCETSGIDQPFERPDGVSIYERTCEAYRLLFVINWTDREAAMDVGDGWHDARSGEPVSDVTIPANDLRILRMNTKTPVEASVE
jgi:beta-galactosidase